MRRQYIEEVNLTLFNFGDLIKKLKILFNEEKCFYEQVSTILVKLMQNEQLNDNERYVVTLNGPHLAQDYKVKVQ